MKSRRSVFVLLAAVAALCLVVLNVAGVEAQIPNPLAEHQQLSQEHQQQSLQHQQQSQEHAGMQTELAAIEAKLDRLEVEVVVDTGACASGAIQCDNGSTGHTFAAAAPDNHNPIRIGVLVRRHGVPVDGIPSAAFDFSNQFAPAGGPAATRCPFGGTGCASAENQFKDGGDGTYILFVHTAPAAINWKAGNYVARLKVTDAGMTGSALVSWDIPA